MENLKFEKGLLGKYLTIKTGKRNANFEIPDGKFRFYTCAKDYSYCDSFSFEGESILISGNGAGVGYVHYYDGLFDAYQRTYVLQNFTNLSPNYVFHYLKAHLRKRIEIEKQDTATPFIKLETLRDFEILFPNEIKLQNKIAEILSTVDTAIEQTEALIAKYQRIKTGLMQDLLTKGIDEHGNIRSKETHRFVIKNGIEVPEEWEVDTIQNHCFHSAFGPRFSGSLYSITGNIGTLRTTDLDLEGYINYKTIPFANLNKADFASHLLGTNDLLITRSGTVGIVSVFEKQSFDVIPGAFLIRFRLKESIMPEYIRYYFRNESGKIRLLDIAEGGVQKNIRGSSVLKLYVPIPNQIEQRKILKILDNSDKFIKNQQLHLSKIQSFKIGLMQDLLSGKVRVKV